MKAIRRIAEITVCLGIVTLLIAAGVWLLIAGLGRSGMSRFNAWVAAIVPFGIAALGIYEFCFKPLRQRRRKRRSPGSTGFWPRLKRGVMSRRISSRQRQRSEYAPRLTNQVKISQIDANPAREKQPLEEIAGATEGFGPQTIGSAPPQPSQRGRSAARPQDKKRQEILAALNEMAASEPDLRRKKKLERIAADLASSKTASLQFTTWWYAHARKISSAGGTAKALQTRDAPPADENELLNLLPIDEIVRAQRPDLNPDDVKRLLLVFIAPGSGRPYFGDHTLGYPDLRNAAIRRMSPVAFEECLDWLTKIGAVSDVKGGVKFSRTRGHDQKRCALNLKRDQTSAVGVKIIEAALRALQILKQSRRI